MTFYIHCTAAARKWFHVYFSEDAKIYKVDTRDYSAVDAWSYQFSFMALQTQTHQSQSMYFIYPDNCIKNPLSKWRPIKGLGCIPLDFFFASSSVRGINESKVLQVDRQNGSTSQGIKLEGRHDQCCGENVKSFFYSKTAKKSYGRNIEKRLLTEFRNKGYGQNVKKKGYGQNLEKKGYGWTDG